VNAEALLEEGSCSSVRKVFGIVPAIVANHYRCTFSSYVRKHVPVTTQPRTRTTVEGGREGGGHLMVSFVGFFLPISCLPPPSYTRVCMTLSKDNRCSYMASPCDAWSTVSSFMHANPAPIAERRPAVPNFILLPNFASSSLTSPRAAIASASALVAAFCRQGPKSYPGRFLIPERRVQSSTC